MLDFQSDMQLQFSFNRELFLQSNQQSIYSGIHDTIDNELDVITTLLSEGTKMLADADDEINIKEITTIINNLNNRLYQHALKMNVLKYKISSSRR